MHTLPYHRNGIALSGCVISCPDRWNATMRIARMDIGTVKESFLTVLYKKSEDPENKEAVIWNFQKNS